MAYADFTLEEIETRFGVLAGPGEVFPDLPPVPPPEWLADTLDRGRRAVSLVGEKARSEFIVAPVLLAARDLIPGDLAIFSGQRLDVDPGRGLVGECDYLIARTTPAPRWRSPLLAVLAVLEAIRGVIEDGLGQCAAQMIAARLFNERAGGPARPVFGCVTSGDVWQFLALREASLVLHRTPLFINHLGAILAALAAVVGGSESA